MKGEEMEKIAKTGNFLVLLPFGIIYFFQTMRFLMFFLPKGLFSTLIALSISILGLKLVRDYYPKVHPIFTMTVMGLGFMVINWLIYPRY
jgi:hypothetical protein